MNTITMKGAVAMQPHLRLRQSADFELGEGEHIAITGPNASGKTLLTEMLCGRSRINGGSIEYHFPEGASHYISDNIRYLEFKDCYGGESDRNYYMQQRWNQWDVDDPRVLLSSGELRKYRMNGVLEHNPAVLILDNPYIGLDVASRATLNDRLSAIASEGRTQLILVLSKDSEVPPFITHVVRVEDGTVLPKLTLAQWKGTREEIIRFNNVTIAYGERTILKDLDWVVHRGEKWALMGPNGSGKSTVLSIVCADNPQSYACDIELFGRKRGTGESIWDIKKHIGYVSPELHRSIRGSLEARRIVAAGLNDYSGFFRTPSDEEYSIASRYLELFGIEDLATREFSTLSSGEQRMVLLARAFVKDPELLILDEPFHGLDERCRLRARRIIEDFCDRPLKTLIMVTHYSEELPACIGHCLTLEKH